MPQPVCELAPTTAEHFHYHCPSRKGYVAILKTSGGTGRPQKSHWLNRLPAAIAELDGQPDVYISQAEFTKPNRKLVNLWRMPVAFADLDTYKIEGLKHLKPEGLLERLLTFCDADGIPPPSLVVFSGRGLQVKWLFSEPVVRAALPRWQAVQVELTERLTSLGSDPAAIDASRVLRLEGSVNSRTGERVRVLHACRTPTFGGRLSPEGVAMYDFDMLADELLPLTRAELAEERRQRDTERLWRESQEVAEAAIGKASAAAAKCGGVKRPAGRYFSSSQLAWDRLEDLRTLIKLRGYERGLPPGERNKYLFLAAVFLAQSCLVADLMSELLELAGQLAPDWTKADIERCAASVVSRAKSAAQGQKLMHGEHEVDPRYRFSNRGIVQWLEITQDEAKQLKCMLPRHESVRRNTERHRSARRSAGRVDRADYLARAAERKAEARALAADGLSSSSIAQRLKVTKAAVNGYLKGGRDVPEKVCP